MSSFLKSCFVKSKNYLSSFWPSHTSNKKLAKNSKDKLDKDKKNIGASKKISHGEQKCKDTLEELYPGYKFTSVRPDILKNPETKHNLEIDCYNDDLKLGIEYQGQQHFRYIKYFHNSIEDFYSQLDRDMTKQRLCVENGITLIIVPYTVTDIKGYLIYILSRYKNLDPNKYNETFWSKTVNQIKLKK